MTETINGIPMTLEYIHDHVDDIIWNRNPIIKFENTYDVHNELVKHGILIEERLNVSGPQSRYPIRTLKYRVNHGNGYITQNIWFAGNVVPTIVDL